MMPDATKIGILYTTSETNSESTLATYNALATTYGFEIVSKGVSTGADIPLALEALLPQVDCLTNLTDNTVVSYLTMVLEMAGEAGKPGVRQRGGAGAQRLHRQRRHLNMWSWASRPAAWLPGC